MLRRIAQVAALRLHLGKGAEDWQPAGAVGQNGGSPDSIPVIPQPVVVDGLVNLNYPESAAPGFIPEEVIAVAGGYQNRAARVLLTGAGIGRAEVIHLELRTAFTSAASFLPVMASSSASS